MTPLMVLGASLLDKLFPDASERAEAETKLLAAQQNGELKTLEISMSAILAEAKSENVIVSSARPMFMWVFYIIILSLGVVAPTLGIWFPEAMTSFYTNVKLGFDAVPAEMWATFTVGYLGYTGAREVGKHKRRKTLQAGESNPFKQFLN